MTFSMGIVPQSFYFQNTKTVATQLLGKIICHRLASGRILKGRIVETEAYLGIDDPACHTFKERKTARTRSMYLDGGHSYIYLIYGLHYCLNFVTRTSAHPEAVLIRALEPLNQKSFLSPAEVSSNGPGKLCRFLHISREQDGRSLWSRKQNLWVLDAPLVPKKQIVTKSRIGVAYAGEASDWPLRFYIRDNRFVSKK